ncbi:MAG: FkbM family methyltransferase [Vicinamibacterales bacterium]
MIPTIDRLAPAASRAAAASALAAAGRAPAYPLEFRSQFGEDALIWTLTGGQLEGFFIEAGAFDGYRYAATYALECLGWTGLLVEAIPERAEECRVRRPRSRVVHAALGEIAGGETTFTVTEDPYGGLLSYVDPKAVGKKSVTAMKSRAVTVPTTTLDALLEGHQGEIDAAVLDVEGVEIPLLRGFDLTRFRPKLLVIEDNSRGADPALADYMAGHPYVQIAWLKVNRVYVREDLAEAYAARLPR